MQEDTLEQVDYSLPKISRSRWIGATLGLFLAAFVMYFPLFSILENKLRKSLAAIPGCPIAYESMHFEFFLPKLVVTNLNAGASCFNQGQALTLERTLLMPRGISFSPLGPNFKIETNFQGTPLEARVSLGIGGASIKTQELELDLAKLDALLATPVKLVGVAQASLLAELGQQGVKRADLKISSKDLRLPGQSIMGLALPRLDINHLLIKAQMDASNNLTVQDIIVGDEDSPVRANFKGIIKINPRVPAQSQMNLTGEVAFSESFMEEFAILSMVLNQFDKIDDFYQIQLQGALTSPIPSSPRK